MTDSNDQPTSPEETGAGADGTLEGSEQEGPGASAEAPETTEAATADDGAAASSDSAAEATDADAPAPQFAELQPEAGAGGQGSLAMLYDLMMPVSVELGRTAMTVRDVLGLGRGSVIPLNRLAGEPIDIYVSDRKLAEGEVVVLGDHFGVRLTKVLSSGGAVSAGDLQAGAA